MYVDCYLLPSHIPYRCTFPNLRLLHIIRALDTPFERTLQAILRAQGYEST